MPNTQTLLYMCLIALIVGVFVSLLIQKIKEAITPSKPTLVLISWALNVLFAFAWCYVLCNMTPLTIRDIVYIVLVGHVGFIGADVFYKSVEGKWSYFKPLSQIEHKDED